ncbi:MAG TPA: DNA polymerase III subunit alpha [Nitrospirae bacterium]|nr:DNA polymerase III subunit alpha [Nitrospirota bacterium]
MSSEYVPLHLHTEYSLLDGAIRINDLIAKAKEFDISTVTMTDHGNLFGAIEFYKKVDKAGLKPIIGCEVYVTDDHKKKGAGTNEKRFHLILLCKDINGYKNLTRLVSKAYIDGFYYKPRIDKNLLEQYSGGLIGLSACLQGEVPYYLRAGMIEKAREAALNYQRILGTDNFYLEIQANELPEQDAVNKQLIELSRDLHIGLVATNDCHYLTKEDAKAHEVLLCIQTGKTLDDADRMRFSKDSFYFKSPDEMIDSFKDVPEAITNTRKVAEKCNLDFKFDEDRLPSYEVPEGEELYGYLEKLALTGLKQKLGGNIPDNYMDRLNRELKMIRDMGFSAYFLIVWDFISYAKSKKIPVGPGRGSAAGSIVAYGLDITDIDPIKYGLLFERFLNPERVSMPDIDVDFCMNRRGEVIEYVTNKYGKDRVAQIITFGTMQARAVIRDVARAMNIPYSEADKAAKLIPFIPKITLETALKMEPKLKELYDTQPEIKELINIAQRLEGIARHASTHAAGVVISPDPLTDFLPLYKAPNDEAITTQFDMDAIKEIKLLKFDFLGLKTLTLIDKAEKIINAAREQKEGKDYKLFSIKDVPIDDEITFILLSTGRTSGVFQLESPGMKDLVIRMEPEVFEDLIALVALYRPGPLGSGMVDEYIEGKKAKKSSGQKKPTGSLAKLKLPMLDEILKETNGIILYQEQVMDVAHKLAGFSLGQADILRKAMGGKDKDVMEKLKNTFIKGSKVNKISEKKAETLFNLILQFAQYGFNKSHSAAYALIAYRTAYLKAHYPVEFMAASLSSDMDNTDKVFNFINECRDMGIKMLPPDINESTREFKVTGNSIRFGLEAVKGVGSSAIDAIISARDNNKFESFFDLCSRVDSRRMNKKVIESLIKAGAMDSFGKRAQLWAAAPAIMDAAMRYQKEKSSGQESMFSDIHEPAPQQMPDVEEWKDSQRLMMEKEALGFYISGHPLNEYKNRFIELSVTSIADLQDVYDKKDVIIGGIIRDCKRIQTKKGDSMGYINVEDMHGNIEVVLFPEIFQEAQDLLSLETPIIISGQTDKNDKGLKVIARKIASIDNNEQIEELKNFKPKTRQRSNYNGSNYNNHKNNGYTKQAETNDNDMTQQYKSLVLTLYNNTELETLPKIEEVFSRHTGSCPVYLKIINPDNWETIFSTNRQVLPSQDIISEIEEILGERSAVLN